MDLLDALGHAGRVSRALQEGRLDVAALDPLPEVCDEVLSNHVDVAVLEVVGQVVIAIDAGAGDHADPCLLGHARHEAHVAAAEHSGRVDDRLNAARLRLAHGHERGLQLRVLVVAARPLHGDGLVAETQVLVDQHDAQLGRLDGPLNCLHGGH